MGQHFELLGSGLHLPYRKLTAADVDVRAGLPSGWTAKHTGVLARYECAQPETLASMAQAAIEQAMQEAGIAWSEVDLIVDGSTCRHQPIPCNAAVVQQRFGKPAEGIACMDVGSTCLGFIVALQVANALFATGTYRHIVIVCSEAALLGVNWKQPESACLMGDGAAAVVLRRADARAGYGYAHQTFSQHLDVCQIRAGGHLLPVTTYTAETDASFRFDMDGPQLLRIAARHLPPMASTLLRQLALEPGDVHVVPHQAAPKALSLVRRLLRFRPERFHNRVASMGNLIAASIPAVLHQVRTEGLLPKGAPVMLLGTSAGYSQAALVFRM
jgi:3-oxoacyl-[acyl-carrier-protein] synthase-3